MRFEIVLAPAAAESFTALPTRTRATVGDALERHLRHEPTKTSKSRIQRLRGLLRLQYRLRVDEIRVFYDVTASTVEILAIIEKREAQAWLTESGTPGPNGGAGESEG